MSQCEEDDGNANMYALSWGSFAFSGKQEHLMKVVPWLMITSIRMVGGCTGTQPTFFFFYDSQVSLTSFTQTEQQHDSLSPGRKPLFFFWNPKHTHVIHQNQRCLVRALHDKLASKLPAVIQQKHSRLLTGTDVMRLNIAPRSDNAIGKKQKIIHSYQKNAHDWRDVCPHWT